MNITQESWKEKAEEKLQAVGTWLRRRAQAELPYVAYGTVAGLTLWPLVEAIATTGQLTPALTALTGVTASVGTNLVANRLEAWRERAGELTEEEVIQWAAQHAENVDARQEMDRTLEELKAVTAAQKGLAEVEREQFIESLRQEMERLGNLPRFQAELEGSGAIAEGEGATAIGPGGVQARDVSGPIITGSNVQIYHTPSPQPLSPQPRQAATGGGGGIAPDLLRRLRSTLERCGPFYDEQELNSVFADSRIALWRYRRPQAPTPAVRLDSTVDFLSKRSKVLGENGLVLFLQVLRDRLHPEDECHNALDALAAELEETLRAS